MRRLDDLESRIASRVSAHRRRAANIIEETPTFRKTHMRIFISHRVEGGRGEDGDGDTEEDNNDKAQGHDGVKVAEGATSAAVTTKAPRPGGKDFSALLHSSAHKTLVDETSVPLQLQQPTPPRKGVRKWTLVIEGGLLIPQLDHESSKIANDRLEKGLPILGWKGDDDDDGVEEISVNKHNNKSTPISTKADIPIRDQWRGGTTERENEKDVEQLHFTHLFDKLEVEFRVVKQFSDKVDSTDNTAITRSMFGSAPETSSPALNSTAENVKSLTWERNAKNSNSTPDAHAFFVVYNEESEYKPMGGKVFKRIFKADRIAARIKLYRRENGDGGNYLPSPQLCNIFFPTFIGKKGATELKSKEKSASSSGKSKKRKREGESPANLLNEALSSTVIHQDETLAGGASTTTPVQDGASSIDENRDAHIPNTLTMDEVLYAIFYYIKTRNLQDVTDLSIINNNEPLTELFGCSRMLFSSVRGLLLEKHLLVKVESGTQPIILNYDMTLEGAEPLMKKRHAKVSSVPKSADFELTTRRRVANPDYEDVQPPSMSEQADVVPHQTMLSCDIDIDIPSLFHVQTRDILRRTKYREFEYSSSRNKAIRSLVSTRIDEETAKQVVADAVSGKGYAPYHRQALIAMAKGSHEGGEAQRAAYIDLRTASLLEKLEEQTSLARGCWDVVDACRGLCDQAS